MDSLTKGSLPAEHRNNCYSVIARPFGSLCDLKLPPAVIKLHIETCGDIVLQVVQVCLEELCERNVYIVLLPNGYSLDNTSVSVGRAVCVRKFLMIRNLATTRRSSNEKDPDGHTLSASTWL